MIDVWYRIVAYLDDTETRAKGIEIMAARVGLTPMEYEPFLAGTRILSRQEAISYLVDKPGFEPLYGSTPISDRVHVNYETYSYQRRLWQLTHSSLTL